MAVIGELDFQSYVAARRARVPTEKHGRTDEHAYAYISDRHTRQTFSKLKPVELAVAHTVRLMKGIGKNELLGHAVKVGPKQFPRLHQQGLLCAKTLGIAPPAIYIRNHPVITAMTYGTRDDAFILVHSALVDHFSDAEVMNVIGHECGHIHNNHVVYLTALHYLQNAASLVLRWAMAPAMLALNAWSRRAEITCDRAGLLCCGDLDVATSALCKLALGSSKLASEFNVEAYLEQYREGQQGIGKFVEMTASHPWLPKRVLALREFSKSQLFEEHVGRATDPNEGLSMEQVDRNVHTIIKIVDVAGDKKRSGSRFS